MSDLIDRQAAIDALMEILDRPNHAEFLYTDEICKVLENLPPAQPDDEETNYWHEKANSYEQTLVRLSQSIAEQPQQWIPVTEKLPERDKDVLVTRDHDGRADHIKSCRYVEVASCYGEDDDVSWISYSDEYKMTPKNHRVVAWMPLPDPWKG